MTISGVGSSLWVKKSAGLYAPVTRRKFPIDGLTLFAPLWHPELQGDTFKSKDLNAHVLTPAGTIWTPQGRNFDGIDDKIVVTPALPYGEYTIEFWFKFDALAHTGLLGFKGSSRHEGIYYWAGGHQLIFYLSEATGAQEWIDSTCFEDGNWHHLAVYSPGTSPYDGTARFYVDGVPVSSGSVTGAVGAWTTFDIGKNGDGTLNGCIGEVRAYNRALTDVEIQTNYLATKWRYR